MLEWSSVDRYEVYEWTSADRINARQPLIMAAQKADQGAIEVSGSLGSEDHCSARRHSD
jgi:hypothetical protein